VPLLLLPRRDLHQLLRQLLVRLRWQLLPLRRCLLVLLLQVAGRWEMVQQRH
jgi:hypothetical protein